MQEIWPSFQTESPKDGELQHTKNNTIFTYFLYKRIEMLQEASYLNVASC